MIAGRVSFRGTNVRQRITGIVLVFMTSSVGAQSTPNDYLRAGKLAAEITVEVLSTDFNGERWSKKVGTGTIIDDSGIVATCSHVLGKQEQPKVRLSNGRIHAARVLGRFPEHDLAVLKFEPMSDVRVAPRLHSGLLAPGTACLCLGFPRSRRSMCTARLKGYEENAETNLIAQDTPIIVFEGKIIPGYSGGPLMTLDGGLIGVVFAMAKDEGVGIAIPIDVLKKDLTRIDAGARNAK